jgi:phenylacetate-CoA ligase
MDDAPTLQQRIYEMLMESQYWPPEQMLAYQRSQLAQLLRHAKATVPFYKTRLDVIFKKNGEIDWDHWHEIPIVTRADFRDRHDEMLATELPPGHGPTKTYNSSGSSGIPIAVEVTQVWTYANNAAAYRFHKLQGLVSTKTIASLANSVKNPELLGVEYYTEQKNKQSPDTENDARRLVLNRNLTEGRMLDILEAEGVAYLFDIPNNIEVLAVANLSRKNPVRLESIVCTGQGLTVDQRNLFQASFGARSVSIYSSMEGGMMGCQCGDSLHYHLNPEIVLVETLTADGGTCAPGEQGRVVITPFFNTASPLIRYEQGDGAELQSPCTCNSNLPVIGNISGRQDQFMRFPEGIRSATGLSQKLLRKNLNALAFQLAQVSTFKVELRYVPADVNTPINPNPIVAHIREIIHPRLDVIFKAVEKTPLNSGGKHQRIVCEIPT